MGLVLAHPFAFLQNWSDPLLLLLLLLMLFCEFSLFFGTRHAEPMGRRNVERTRNRELFRILFCFVLLFFWKLTKNRTLLDCEASSHAELCGNHDFITHSCT